MTNRTILGARALRALEALEPRTLLSTFYVSPSGNDANAGTSAAPWRTLQHASDVAGAGDSVVARPGNYAGFNITNGGTSSARITFRGESGATINQPVTIGNRYGINGSGRQYVTVEGFTFAPQAGQGEWYAGVRLGGTPGNWVRGNVVRDNTFTMRVVNQSATPDKYGIYSSWNDGLLVEGNAVSGTYNSGIYTANSARNYTVRGNTVADAGGNGIHNNGDLSAGSPGIIHNATIANNVLRNTGFGIGGQAISCDGVQDSRVQNNLLFDVHAKGISLYVTNGAQGSRRNHMVNNTIVCVASGASMRINHDSSNNTVRNNIFIASAANQPWTDSEESGLIGSSFDYNVTFGQARVGGVVRNDWSSHYGFDVHSIRVTNPAGVFADLAGDDYHLSATSPAIDAGTPTNAPPIDLEGNPRPSGGGFDIGAYERQAAQPAPAVASGAFAYLAAQQLVITFTQDVGASLSADDLVLENLTGGTTVPAANMSLDYNAATMTATFTFPGYADGILPDGNDRATLPAGSVTNAGGVPMASDYVLNFFFLQGDANHDGRVNLDDFNTLASNFGQTNQNFGDGDFNYDGLVNLADFNLLASQFGETLEQE